MTCIHYPGSPAVPSTPVRVVRTPDIGWDSGADSIDTRDGSLHVVFPMPLPTVGAVCGLKPARGGVGIPELLPFALLFQNAAGTNYYGVFELGTIIGSMHPRSSLLNESFEIRRVNNVVSYLINGALFYTSTRASYGPLIVSACLYYSGDSIG